MNNMGHLSDTQPLPPPLCVCRLGSVSISLPLEQLCSVWLRSALPRRHPLSNLHSSPKMTQARQQTGSSPAKTKRRKKGINKHRGAE